MFRTDFNHLLQAFDSPFLYKFMLYVSFLGSTYMIILAILILIGGVNFRKGYMLINLLGWSVLLMLGAKNYADYPRPIAVDATLNSFGKEITDIDYSAMQPEGFFELFSPELLAKTRASEIGRYGLPSGHVILITVIWLGMALLFDKRWLWILSILVVLLTAISRMYLGVHYLGDVIGGLIIGLAMVSAFKVIFKKLKLGDGIKLEQQQLAFFLAPVVLLPFYNVIPGFQGGMFIGFNLALLLIIKMWGEPQLVSSAGKRTLNGLLFSIIFFAGYYFLKRLPLADAGLISMASFVIVNFVVVMAFFYIGRRLRLYKDTDNEQIS